jgi:hypothetical protein
MERDRVPKGAHEGVMQPSLRLFGGRNQMLAIVFRRVRGWISACDMTVV